jgi:hypothetical protein
VAASGSQTSFTEWVADKGYKANALVADCEDVGIRTSIPKHEQKPRRWGDKPAELDGDVVEPTTRATKARPTTEPMP